MKAAAIICPGPSLDPSIIPALHEQCDRVVACNRGFKAWDSYRHLDPDAVYFVDSPSGFKDCKDELQNIGGMVYTPDERGLVTKWAAACEAATVSGLPVNNDREIEKNPFEFRAICRPLKVALFAWQHLVRSGYGLIAIAGCDGTVDPMQRFFFAREELSPRRVAVLGKSYGTVIECFKHWLPHAETRGSITVNLSGQSSALSNYIESIKPTEISQWLSKRA